MALDNFIPEVWSSQLLTNLRNTLVYAQPGVINRNYEGEIANVGDTVRINSIGPITINNYSKNTDILPPQELEDEQRTLLINQQKYFNFQVDDVDRAQQRPQVMDEAMREAAYGLASVADQYVAGLYVNVPSAGQLGDGAAPLELADPGDAYELLVDLAVNLDEKNIPDTGRWVVVPSWFHGLLLLDDRFNRGTTAGDDVIRNGRVGTAAGFTIMKANTVPQVMSTETEPRNTFKIIAGHNMGASYAEQINKVEAYRPQLRFADAVKGLHIYGAALIRPEAWSVATVVRPA